MNNSGILIKKNAKFLGYFVYMNLNIWEDFQICISVPLSTLHPVDTGRKLNVHKTFRRRPGSLPNVLCMFNLRPVFAGTVLILLVGNLIVWYRLVEVRETVSCTSVKNNKI